MEPNEWSLRTRLRRITKTLPPAMAVFEATEYAPSKVKVSQWGEAIA